MDFKNCSPNGGRFVSKVQYLFSIKLFTTANENPKAFENIYLNQFFFTKPDKKSGRPHLLLLQFQTL